MNIHEKTASHERKLDPEFAAAEEAANIELNSGAGGDEFFCGVCGNGYDFKTIQNLNIHEKTASHEKKT